MEGTNWNLQFQPNSGEIQFPFSNSLTLTLPEDFIFEQILPRLPVKSLIRFKSVCKGWYNIISSSEFVKTHLKFSSSSPLLLLDKDFYTIDGLSRELYLLSYHKYNQNLELAPLDCQLHGFKYNHYIVGSCNGLICFYFYGYSGNVKFILWNPIIRNCRIIRTRFKENLWKCGFGYASDLEDYKIIGAFFSYADQVTRVRVFSLRLGEWKQIDVSEVDMDNFSSACGTNGVCVDSSLYWIMKRSEESIRIICYDLNDEQLREQPVMISECCFYKSVTIEVYKGCLSLRCHWPDLSLFEVWIMKKRDDWNSWKKWLSLPCSYYSFSHMAFSSTGRSLVECMGKLKLIDPILEDVEHAQAVDFGGFTKLVAYQHVESFISPFGTM